MKIWLNGQFIDRDSARISVFDAGLQHAVGLFETMAAVNGVVFRADHHVQRLADSARELGLSERLHVEPLIAAVQHAITHNDLDEARLRLTVTGGDLNALQSQGQSPADPTILIVPQPPTPYPEQMFTQGVSAVIADGRLNPFDPTSGHKTLNYWSRIRALQLAGSRNASEAIWFSVSNHLAAGSVSNIFLVKDGALQTPIARGEEEDGAIPAPVRPGVTRETIIQLAENRSIPVERKMLDIDALLGADEVFLTNSSWGVLPVVQLERETIGPGDVGMITADLRQDWLVLRDAETAGGPEVL